jgi:hypothetical protein
MSRVLYNYLDDDILDDIVDSIHDLIDNSVNMDIYEPVQENIDAYLLDSLWNFSGDLVRDALWQYLYE